MRTLRSLLTRGWQPCAATKAEPRGRIRVAAKPCGSRGRTVARRPGTLAGCAEGQCFQDMRFVNVVQALRARPDVEQWVRGGMSE